MTSMRLIRGAAWAAAALSMLTGCSDDEHVACPSEPAAIDSFTVDAATVAAGESVTATISVSGFELSVHEGEHHAHGLPLSEPQHEDDSAAVCAGGHVHVYLDDLMTNPLAMTIESSFDLAIPDDAAAGEHVFIARLHSRDHTIFQPEVVAEATITVTAP